MKPTAPIIVRGARTHNLREVDLDVARGQLTVFCGVSGSGKTSMAIDTLHAEGQRRYIESFSAYTRQFLEQLDKPDVDQIEGVPPTIAVTQQNQSRSNRTTVATTTEVADYLRLLFARIGKVYCTECGRRVEEHSPESIALKVADLPEGLRLMVAYVLASVEIDDASLMIDDLRQAGFLRVIVNGTTTTVDDIDPQQLAAADEVLVIVDRLSTGNLGEGRAQESIESALDQGHGSCVILWQADDGTTDIDGRRWHRRDYKTDLHCAACDRDAVRPEPRLLDFNSPLGACTECEGFGSVSEIDMGKVVPDESKTLKEGAVAPWNTPAYAHELQELLALADDYKLRIDVPYSELTEEEKRIVAEGVPERDFGGLAGFFRWLEKRKYKMHLRVFLSRWRSYRDCPTCGGARLRPEALAVKVDGRNLAELYGMEIREALAWLESLELDETRRAIAKPLLADILPRLGYLAEVGVDYLTLNRPLRTLSTGEAQRVAMTTTLGSALVDMLYVLDEPTGGLHRSDSLRLLDSIRKLRDRGNTVLVVEHDETLITGADQVVEFGPLAGTEGGEVVFQGPPSELPTAESSPTGDWLAGRRLLGDSENRRPAEAGMLTLIGASGNNLQNITVDFPLGVFAAVTGVSGAGKSTLVQQTLYPALAERLYKASGKSDHPPLPCDDLLGSGQLEDVVLVDQSPVARSPRSNPVTYVKAFDPIRALFAEQPEASLKGLTASHFSFNVEGGRCERCQGAGQIEVDMQFLADVYMTCGDCQGRRYKPEVLDVAYRGVPIDEVLDMTVVDAFRFFRGHNKLQSKLKCLLDVGLHYVRLGQPANTLSGGEAQRLKLASYLSAKRRGRTLFILDEPSTGLHFSDVVQLVDCFDALIDVGHSVLVVEHNVPLLQAADYIIDIGPGAAGDGGRVVAHGTPEQVAKCPESATGRVLAVALERQARSIEEARREEEAID
ncbi:excinuclease ABC subunit UvrA [Aeoliella mucimassa]|uniref:UvrABC system protein A n=1 Tax=Aeoliella mucimassa TaxID=2527972 RepID=A0A518ASU2_9BACT|nr:excinuclease ABC subunit UvrA [Aeoliella mucimassa]QDU57803.1 UvrABC system protein A [Aeoliella mucimassa]